MSEIPSLRLQTINDCDPDPKRDYVLYWMIANRRTSFNFGLQRAIEWARRLKKPLVILEALSCDYPWASDRFHQFITQGMADNSAALSKQPVLYYPYLEPQPGHARGLLRQLATRASVVVTDDFPCFFLPRIVRAADRFIDTRYEAVDSNGLLPMRAADKVFSRAFDFRRFLQKNLLPHLADMPRNNPFSRLSLPILQRLPIEITKRWPPADVLRRAESRSWGEFAINHDVAPVETPGGRQAATLRWNTFLKRKLPKYAEERNQPGKDATSRLSAYLHFGHISVHEIFEDLMRHQEWTPDKVAAKATGSSSGWWGVDESSEAFLDELITWRELGYNMCWQRDDYDQFDSLPEWARKTLAEHANDPRDHVYDLQQFESAGTHDMLWNAAQRQLVCEGRIHNYLRMLWGKKILEWTESPQTALRIMIELNNKYAIDGRNPNSYSGIFWVLGRYDRAWGPERPIFGKIRYMSSDNTARKFRVKSYIEQYAPGRGDLFCR